MRRTVPETRKTWQVSPVPCSRCERGLVLVQETVWPSGGGGVRRSVWADEPVRCSSGCLLSDAEVRRVLLAVYGGRAGAAQLPLLLEAAG